MAGDANVRVVVSAITEAAEQAMEDVGDEMSGLADDALVGQTGLDQLSDEMSQAQRGAIILQTVLGEMSDEMRNSAAVAQVLQSQLDKVADEATQAAASSTAASGSFSSMSISAGAASLSVSGLSKAFTLSLIPAVLTAATVIAPLVALLGVLAAGAVAVAGAFGLIIGSGILAFGEQKASQNREELAQTERLINQYESMRQQQGALTAQEQSRLRQLKQKKSELEDQTTIMGALQDAMADVASELKPLIVEFGEEFIPLIRDGLDAIPDVAREMMNAVGSTGEFKNALRDFGVAAAEVLPALTAAMFTLARDALPVLRELFGWLGENGPGIWDAMMQSVKELEPEWRNLLDALIEMGPVLLEFGTNVGKVLIPAITMLIRGLTWLMAGINDLDSGLRTVVIAGLLLAPVLIKIISLASSLATVLGYGGLTGALSALGSWLVAAAPSAFQLGYAFGTISSYASAAASAIAGSTAALVAIGAIIGLIGVKILDMLGAFTALEDAGASARDMLGGDLADSILVLLTILTLGLFPVIAAIGAAIIELVRGDISGAVDNFQEVMGIFGDAFGNVWDMVVDGSEAIADAIVNAFTSAGQFLWNWIASMGNALINFFMNTLPNMVIDGITWATAVLESGLNRIWNMFTGLWNDIAGFAVQIFNRILDSVEDFINNWIDRVNGLIDEANKVPGVDMGSLGHVSAGNLDENALDRDERETDIGTIQERHRGYVDGAMQQINNTEVSVDVGGDLKSNPHSFSRDLADQVNGEQRTNNGA